MLDIDFGSTGDEEIEPEERVQARQSRHLVLTKSSSASMTKMRRLGWQGIERTR